MNVYVGQIYIEAGVNFPYSYLWQIWLSDQMSLLTMASAEFVARYGADFKLGIRISARKQLAENEIKGPTVFRKYRNVEYTLFLPYDVIIEAEDGCRVAMEFILKGIQDIFAKANIEAEEFGAKKAFIIDHVCSDATMLKKPWPRSAGK